VKKSEFYWKIRKYVAVMTAILLKISKSYKSQFRQLLQLLQSTRPPLIIPSPSPQAQQVLSRQSAAEYGVSG